MAELKRALCSRRGYRTHLKKILASVDELLEQPQPLSEDNIATLRDLHEQLQRKHELITPLDAKILEAMTEDSTIETEVLQAEETNTSISTAKAKISHRLCSISARDTTNRPITKLYPLELNTADEVSLGVKKGPTVELDDLVDSEGETIRPQRASAKKATDQVKEWVRILSGPPEDVAMDEL